MADPNWWKIFEQLPAGAKVAAYSPPFWKSHILIEGDPHYPHERKTKCGIMLYEFSAEPMEGMTVNVSPCGRCHE